MTRCVTLAQRQNNTVFYLLYIILLKSKKMSFCRFAKVTLCFKVTHRVDLTTVSLCRCAILTRSHLCIKSNKKYLKSNKYKNGLQNILKTHKVDISIFKQILIKTLNFITVRIYNYLLRKLFVKRFKTNYNCF